MLRMFTLWARILRCNATGTHMSSFLLATMRLTYCACASDHGSGTMNRMRRLMDENLQGREIFRYVRHCINVEMQQAIDEMTNNIQNLVLGMCGDIDGQINVVRGSETKGLERTLGDMEKIRNVAVTSRAIFDHFMSASDAARRKA